MKTKYIIVMMMISFLMMTNSNYFCYPSTILYDNGLCIHLPIANLKCDEI